MGRFKDKPQTLIEDEFSPLSSQNTRFSRQNIGLVLDLISSHSENRSSTRIGFSSENSGVSILEVKDLTKMIQVPLATGIQDLGLESRILNSSRDERPVC
jgi:hypothetical protein